MCLFQKKSYPIFKTQSISTIYRILAIYNVYCIMNSMPNKTIYIRNEDVELWDNLKDKSQKVSELLNGTHKPSVQSVTKKVQKIIKDETPINIPGVTKGVLTEPTGDLWNVLNHEYDIVATVPLEEAQELIKKNPGWDRLRA